MKKTQNLTSNM